MRDRARIADLLTIRSRHAGRLRVLQGAIALVLTIATVVLAVDGRRSLIVDAGSLDLVLSTTSALVALAVAFLGFVRSREADDAAALYDGAAFLLFATANATHVGVIVAGLDRPAGLDLRSPSAAPLYVGALVRTVSAGMLLAGAMPRLRHRRFTPRQRAVVMVLPTVAVAVLSLGMVLLGPSAVDEVSGSGYATTPLANALAIGGPAVVALNLVGVVLVSLAALLRPRTGGGALPEIWLATALTFGAFSALHALIYPSPFVGVITSADVMQLAFYATLFTAVHATRAADLSRAREADNRRRRYYRTDVAAAARSERLRLARELHDGVVQQLLAIRREQELALAAVERADPSAAEPVRRVNVLLGEIVKEARQTIEHLRLGEASETCLVDTLTARQRVFSERYGHTVEFRADPSLASVCGPRAAEILRVVDEALANIRRHADATNVRLSAIRAGDQLILTVSDNGRGFAVEHTPRGHGLTGMHERAELLGGRLAIYSGPGEGTQLRLFAPLSSDNDD